MMSGTPEPASDEKQVAFVENAAGSGAAASHAATGGGDGPRPDIGSLPSYKEILSSEDPITTKAKTIYTVSRARVEHQFASVRPWSEFFDRNFFCSPEGTTDVVNRLNRNIAYFYSNYVLLSLACSSYVLLINLAFSICVIFVVLAYFYIRSRSDAIAEDEGSDGLIYIMGKGYTPMQLYLFLLVFAGLAFYVTSGSSVVFWLFITSLGVTCGHASMRRPPLEEHSAFQLA